MRLAASHRSAVFDRATNWLIRGLILLALRLPYETRIAFFAWIVSRIVAPLTGQKKRVRANLKLVMPELTEAEIDAIYRGVTDNFGRSLIETYSFDDLCRRFGDTPLSGEGYEALKSAKHAGQPVILVTGHFGNYCAARAVLTARGHAIGAVYRPFSNRFFDAHYRAALDEFGPTFARGSAGTADMVRHLKAGGLVAIFSDQHFSSGADLEFFGLPAKTATAAARLALKYDAPMVPIYGVRGTGDPELEVVIEPPIPTGTLEEMTQALNDSFEAIIRKHPEQWLWTHRRWR